MNRLLDTSLPRTRRPSLLTLVIRLITATGRSMERARTRRVLAQLNEQQLSDVGISHSDRLVELDKPFWR
ncbi:DUF1127 domain-containing protein [Pseudomonas sp. 6D_7.1_Bac1]|jgi:uncharacterized protein YjiS (DUF1127 family)|uniref:DUF1127 domain-containing protein n=1 Tax=Pseudomonas sp. 6D_7.1_Bac1 TaxID=2971615 RepID=UPI0021C5C32C|nr:DUF1127 domain-containing protein [Pseudomonas sp. 6D_7.1_Bac1]MCU1748277.1 DUF1127 domain-containing protein [Pseudomonas sp. 6D_7.1_Bac1]